jgi:hypothetical protein
LNGYKNTLLALSSLCPSVGNFFLAHRRHIVGMKLESAVAIERQSPPCPQTSHEGLSRPVKSIRTVGEKLRIQDLWWKVNKMVAQRQNWFFIGKRT